MDSGAESCELVTSTATELLPHDLKEVEAVSKYANKQENKMKKLTDEVDKMGKLKSIWDSKIPEINKQVYYFFSFKESNCKEIKAEIDKYLEFYKQMRDVVLKISHCTETENDVERDVYTIILDLYGSLTELAKSAEMGKKTTGSSTICDLHRKFISKHEKLENLIKRVECVSLKQSWKKATEDLQKSLKAIDGLRDDVRASNTKYDNLCDKFDNLLSQNKKLIKQQNFLLEENAKVMQQQQILLDDNKHMKEQTDILISIITSIAVEAGKKGTTNINNEE